MKIELQINGEPRTLDVDPMRRLLDVLREDMGLTGTKEGCGEGECGACSVLIDGKLANSCLVPIAQCDGTTVTTVEGLTVSERGRVITESFAKMHSAQCGFCTPGMVMATEALLEKIPEPGEEEIRHGLSGNICRCTGYDMIVDGVQEAAKRGKGLW